MLHSGIILRIHLRDSFLSVDLKWAAAMDVTIMYRVRANSRVTSFTGQTNTLPAQTTKALMCVGVPFNVSLAMSDRITRAEGFNEHTIALISRGWVIQIRLSVVFDCTQSLQRILHRMALMFEQTREYFHGMVEAYSCSKARRRRHSIIPNA